MASTQIQTVSGTPAAPQPHAHAMARAGTRLWAIVCGSGGSDTGVNLFYSDNDGGSWTKPTGGDLDTGGNNFCVAIDVVQVGATYELHCAWAAGDATYTLPLKYANILSNVDAGTPGTITVNTVDAGGANAGVLQPSICITPTGSNPKVWIVACKNTAAGPTVENRLWRAPTTTASPTWTSYNDINSTSSSSGSGTICFAYGGCMAYWTVSAATKLTVVVKHRTGSTYDAFTFDPSAASPTLGSATNFSTGSFDSTVEQSGSLCCINAKADYLIFGRNNAASYGTWDFYKTVNGTSWTNPTGWTALTLGHCSIAYDGTNFWIVHTDTAGTIASTATQLKYRQVTVASDTMGGVTNYSDTNGRTITVPRDTGSSKLYGDYRASTTSPYSYRSDFVSIGGGGDVTPPGQASLLAVANTAGARIDLAAFMPPDVDVSQLEIRRLTGTYPATNRSDGTVIVAPTNTSASAEVDFSDTSLSNGTRYYYRCFVKDTAGNWNTGATATAVAAIPLVLLQRYTAALVPIADGTTPLGNSPVFEFQMATGCFEAAKVAHFRLRNGNDQADPPTQVTTDLVSSSGGSLFKYEDPAASGIFVDVPITGLLTTFFGRKLRVTAAGELASSRWGSIHVEQ